MSTLVLVRHGLSAHVHADGALDRAGVEQWRLRYDAAGLHAADQPPTDLVTLAAGASWFASSDLPRAVESADRLATGRAVHASPLLREIVLGIPEWPTRLSLGVWGALIYVTWRYRALRGADPHAAEGTRAAAAATFAMARVPAGATGIIVTHGAFRKLLASELLAREWRCTGRRGGYAHWSAWIFQSPGDSA